jgi:outer membrane protein assembly factor BamB
VLAVGGTATGATALLLDRFRHSGPPWTYHPPKSVYKGPVAAVGNVYVSDLDRRLLAIDAHSGRPRWIAPIASSLTFAPTVAGGVGYLTNGGELTAFDPGTGRQLWQRSSDPATLYPTPSVSSGLAFLGGTPRTSPGEYLLTAYDARTGEPRWTYQVPARVGGDPAPSPGLVHVGGDDGFLRALDATRGGLRWQQNLGAPIRSTPRAAGGSVLVTTDAHGIVAVDAATGRIRWRARPGTYGSVTGSLFVIRETTVFFGAPGRLFAHDLADGRLRWQHDLGETMPVTAGGMAFLAVGKTLYGLGLADGVTRWQQAADDEAKGPPVLAGGAVHVLGFSGVRSYAQATGRLLRRKEGLLLSDSLTTDGTTIYFASDYHTIHALPGRP